MPCAKYEYLHLPQGLANSPDIFQGEMNKLFKDLEFVQYYLDDLLVLSKGDFDDHLIKLEKVFKKLRFAGLQVNAPKSFFGRQECNYLGYVISRTGIHPQPKKVDAILWLEPPNNKRELRCLIGLINYYRDVWPQQLHLMAPLTAMISKNVPFKWLPLHQKAFDDLKRVISKEVLLSYPDFNKPFDIHTDASDLQLGAVISQNNKPIAFYSRKLNSTQKNYTVGEKELLSIVEVLKEFRTILLGHEINIYTDHKNLIYKDHNNYRVIRWRLLLEEYGPNFIYIKGAKNIAADAMSCLDTGSEIVRSNPSKEQTTLLGTEDCHIMQVMALFLGKNNAKQSILRNEDFDELHMAECFVSDKKESEDEFFPLNYSLIDEHQHRDPMICKKLRNEVYSTSTFCCGGNNDRIRSIDLITYNKKIVVPSTLQKQVLNWYHSYLLHPGMTRTEETIIQHFYWHNI